MTNNNMITQRERQVAIGYYFLVVGCVLGNWVARIPEIKKAHGLDDATFGLVLIAAIGGGLLGIPIVSTITEKYGSNKAALFGSISIGLLTPIIAIPLKQVWILVIGMICLGFGWGILDVGMNTQASLFEKINKTHSMGLFHSAYALGGLLGSLLGGVLSEYHVSPLLNFLAFALSTIPFSVYFHYKLYGFEDESALNNKPILSVDVESATTLTEAKQPLLSATDKPSEQQQQEAKEEPVQLKMWSNELYPLCAIMFVATMGEGSIGDWITVYQTQNLHFSSLVAAIGFSLFSLMLAIGRYGSDHLRKHFDTKLLIVCSGLLSFAGLLMISFAVDVSSTTYRLALTYTGLILTGGGISICMPILTSVTSTIPDMDSTNAIATVTAFAYIGALVGPPLFGGLAALLKGLNWALLVDSVLLLLISVFALFIHKSAATTASGRSKSIHSNNIVNNNNNNSNE